MGMNKSGLALTIRILYFALALPFTEQKYFASGMRGNFQHLIYMLFFHHQNQIRFIDNVGCELPCLECFGTVSVIFEDLPGRSLDTFANPGSKSCGRHGDGRGAQRIAQ